jgi:hypothetical protein
LKRCRGRPREHPGLKVERFFWHPVHHAAYTAERYKRVWRWLEAQDIKPGYTGKLNEAARPPPKMQTRGAVAVGVVALYALDPLDIRAPGVMTHVHSPFKNGKISSVKVKRKPQLCLNLERNPQTIFGMR